MWLAVDCGNSRVKWATVRDETPAPVQAAKIGGSRAGLREPAAAKLRAAAARASHAWISHVGAALSRRELRAVLHPCPVRFVQSAAHGGGVINRYQPPDSLGADRWLALVAARELRRDVAMICAGTAATIDFLRRDGVFVGGAILPGAGLARDALANRTGLKTARRGMKTAQITLPPRDTQAAAATGAAAAIVGAALFLRQRILPDARFVVGGGDAELLSPWLPDATPMPYPTIRGLVRLHKQNNGARS